MWTSISIVLVLGVASTYAGYCPRSNPNCCFETGVGQRSCNGSGTSDVSDLFYEVFGGTGRDLYCISGKRNDIFRVWKFYYEFAKGIQSVGHFVGLYAYFFQIPKSCQANNTEYDYFILEMGVCPILKPVTDDTYGVVAGTDLSYKNLLQIVQYTTQKAFLAPCQIITGTHEIPVSDEHVAINTRTSIHMSSLLATNYAIWNNTLNRFESDRSIASLINRYDLYVKQASYYDSLYYQDGYPNGAAYACTDSSGQPGFGYYYRAMGYDPYENLNGPGQVSSLAQQVAQYMSQYPVTPFSYDTLTFVEAPFQRVATLSCLSQGTFFIPAFTGLFSGAI